MTHKIIGITGPMGCGKDTAADFIVDEYPHYIKTAFAAPMKSMLIEGLGLTYQQVYGIDKNIIDDRYECTPRHMLQTIGTEWGRDLIHKNIWVTALDRYLRTYVPIDKKVIIADVRFENEAKFVRERGRLIHIVDRKNFNDTHVSEDGIVPKNEDIILHNQGGLRGFQNATLEVIRFIEQGF